MPDFTPASATEPAPLVFRRSARARHYRLTLRRDGTAVATIPARGSQREAERFVDGHREWLERARERQRRRPRGAGLTSWSRRPSASPARPGPPDTARRRRPHGPAWLTPTGI